MGQKQTCRLGAAQGEKATLPGPAPGQSNIKIRVEWARNNCSRQAESRISSSVRPLGNLLVGRLKQVVGVNYRNLMGTICLDVIAFERIWEADFDR